MERVAFLVESTGERISCLLNPEHLELKRLTGVQVRRAHGGLVTGTELADDPLMFTGGGTTELTMNLLFDTQLQTGIEAVEDVRDLTGPLWELAENGRHGVLDGKPAVIRFIWGKAWNMPGVVCAVAERLEYFAANGLPQRSWLRLKMLRVAETADDLLAGTMSPPPLPDDETVPELDPNDALFVHEVSGEMGDGDLDGQTERLDQLGYQYYGAAAAWRVLATINNIADPLRLGVGRLLQIHTDSKPRRPGQ